MSREVPMDQPLSDEDREYLHSRGEHARVEQLDEAFPPDDDEEEYDEELETEEPDGPEEESDDNYDTLTAPELAKECERQGLAKSGTRLQMIERLREHNEAQVQA